MRTACISPETMNPPFLPQVPGQAIVESCIRDWLPPVG
jgi:hypothetical protein